MKKFAFLILLVMFFTGAVSAAEKPTVGYVNLHKVLLESKVGKRNKADLDRLIKEKESTLAGEESKLQALQQAFQKDQLLMTDAQKLEKQKAFQEKAEAYQKMVGEAKQAVSKKDSEFANKSAAEIKAVVADVVDPAEERRHEGGADRRGQDRLGRREHQGHIDRDVIGDQTGAGGDAGGGHYAARIGRRIGMDHRDIHAFHQQRRRALRGARQAAAPAS